MSTLNVKNFGAVGNGVADDVTAIQNCMNAAVAGHDVYFPAGTYKHGNTIIVPQGVKSVFGDGDTSLLQASLAYFEALILRSSGTAAQSFRLHDLKLRGVGSPRGSTPASQKVWVDNIHHFEIDHITVADTTTGGIFHQGCSFGWVHDNIVINTHADCIHFTHGSGQSHDNIVSNNQITSCRDDSIAVVSYGTPQHFNFEIFGNIIREQEWGRGITLDGLNLHCYLNDIKGNSVPSSDDRAGINISCEPAYNGPSVSGICVHDNILEECGGLAAGHTAILVYNGVGGASVISDVKITNNTFKNSRRSDIGLAGSGKITMNYYGNIHQSGSFSLFNNANTNPQTVASTTPVAGCPPVVVTPANIVYVSSVNGNNANSGLDSAHPKLTIAAGIAALAAGDGNQLLLERGSTFSANINTIPFSGFELNAYGTGAFPRVQTAGGGAYVVNIDKKTTIKNVEFFGPGFLIHVATTAVVVIDNNSIVNYGTPNGQGPGTNGQGIRVDQSEDFTLSNNVIDNQLNAVNGSDHVWFAPGATTASSNFKCFGNSFKYPGHNSGDHLHLNNIQNADIHHNYFGPADSGKGAIITQLGAANVHIYSNTFEECGNYCYAVSRCLNFEFDHNIVKNVIGTTWSNCVRFAWDVGEGGTTTGSIHDNVFVGCQNAIGAVDMYDPGVGSVSVTIEHNTFVDPAGINPTWLRIEAPGPNLPNWVIRFNLVRNSAAATTFQADSGFNCTDNWFENTPTTGTLAKTGAAGLDTNYFPTVPAASGLPYGARINSSPPGQRPPKPANIITGTAANDTLTAPGGVETLLNGLGGNDVYVFAPGCLACEVDWFTRNPPVEQDKLDISAFGWTNFSQFMAAVTLEPIPGGTFNDVPWHVLVIHFNATDSVWLNSVLDIQSTELIYATPSAGGQPSAARRRFITNYGSEGVS